MASGDHLLALCSKVPGGLWTVTSVCFGLGVMRELGVCGGVGMLGLGCRVG
jgi:hypothetical protein